MPLLEGKTALIAGVANKWSLAYAIGQAFRREGAKVLLSYQSERQRGSVEDLGADLGAAEVFPCDVGKDQELAHLAEIVGKHGRLDTLVHSVAFAYREDLNRPFVETSRAGYLLAQDVSAYSMVGLARVTAPLMTAGGSMMTLTYLGSTRVVQNYNVMGVAKAALEAAVRYLANDLGPQNIRVNAISAGPVKTASARAVKDLSSMLEKAPERAPLRRNCEPAELADSAVFLASDLSRGVTGNSLFVDAGLQLLGV